MISYLVYNAVFFLVVAPESVDLLLVGMTLVMTAIGLRRFLSGFDMSFKDTERVRNLAINGRQQQIGGPKQQLKINER